ncbi:MAG: sigma-70 family RNA polymerase sigma factor [Bacteroidales bacterium]|nr:sigma-70 family RNA polymerase sigma factor [Bacteroidales bacterium]
MGKGSVDAFDRLYLIFRPKVDKVVGSIIGGGVSNYNMVNDIAQNIFLKVWKNRAQIASTVRDFDAYLFKMTKNEALLFLSRYRMPFDDLHDNIPALSPDDIQLSVEARDLQKRVAAAVKLLPPQQQRVFELSRINQLSYIEIAQALDISPKTVENHLSRALKDIKKTIS